MKARKVKGLDPDGELVDNARRIVAVRLAELTSFADSAFEPDAVEALHDMRIAAKRVRYVLELMAPVLGKEAERGAKQARKLQDLLGEIHDCDVMVPRVERHIERLRTEDAAAVRDHAGSGAEDLDPAAAKIAPNRRLYRGLESLDAYLRARRDVLYAHFVREWAKLERAHFAEKLAGAVGAD
jgi:CHAD domain-containing protein